MSVSTDDFREFYVVIQRKKDGALVAGSDFRYSPPHCIIADKYRPPLFIPLDERCQEVEIARRKINLKRYKFVVVELSARTMSLIAYDD